MIVDDLSWIFPHYLNLLRFCLSKKRLRPELSLNLLIKQKWCKRRRLGSCWHCMFTNNSRLRVEVCHSILILFIYSVSPSVLSLANELWDKMNISLKHLVFLFVLNLIISFQIIDHNYLVECELRNFINHKFF